MWELGIYFRVVGYFFFILVFGLSLGSDKRVEGLFRVRFYKVLYAVVYDIVIKILRDYFFIIFVW